MTIKQLISEIIADNEYYDNQNLIDELSLYNWALMALKPFGNNICNIDAIVVPVEGGKGRLPDNFYALRRGEWCTPRGYCVKGNKSVLQNTRMWTERIEHGETWNSCDTCCKEISNKTIVEKFYIDENTIEFHYDKSIPVKLGKLLDKTSCADDCYNRKVKQSPYEIVIREKIVHTNFQKGTLYIEYYGYPIDEENELLVPDTSLGEVRNYIEAYLYLKMYEKLLRNKSDENIITLFNYYASRERDIKFRALTDSKASRLSPEVFKTIRRLNRIDMLTHEINFPTV